MPEHNYKTAHLADQVATLEEAPELWRSPTTAADRSGDPLRQDRRDTNGEGMGQIRLADQVAAELWPTPRVHADRSSRSAMVENSQWSAPSLEQMAELAEGNLPREIHSEAELTPQARRVYEAARLWPTPQAHDAAAGQAEHPFRLNGAGNRNLNDFTAMVEERLWNTPTAHDMKNDALPPSLMAWGDTLPGDVLREMWRTPNAQIEKGGWSGKPDQETGGQASQLGTADQVAQVEGKTSVRLNPEWVSLLMNFPVDWTSLD